MTPGIIASAVLGAVCGLLAAWPAARLSVAWGEPARTACGACGSAFSPTWVRLKRRCASCATPLMVRPVWTALTGAVAFALLAWTVPRSVLLIACLFLAGLGVLLAVVDLAVQRLPDPVVLAGFAGVVPLLTLHALLTGTWSAYGRAWLGGAALLVAYLVFALLPGAPMGLGDVKLAGVLGLILGYLGWTAVVVGALLPFLLNGPYAVVLFIRKGRKARAPFGPALLAGWLLTVVLIAPLAL
ncbi:MAG: prepilin peptidase [Hamadaea sp.]|nr:prepilin peptidase [Hamadaea sp.]